MQIMKKLYKTCLGYEKWFKKSGNTHKPWLEPEHSKLPMLNRSDIPTTGDDDDEFDVIEDEIDETTAEMEEKQSNGSEE